MEATADLLILTANFLLDRHKEGLENMARRIASGTSVAPEQIARLAEAEVLKLRTENRLR